MPREEAMQKRCPGSSWHRNCDLGKLVKLVKGSKCLGQEQVTHPAGAAPGVSGRGGTKNISPNQCSTHFTVLQSEILTKPFRERN